MFSACLLVILNPLPFCWLSIILLASLTLPLIPTQGTAEEGGILQPAVAHSQYHWGAVLLPSSSLLGLPGVLQGSFTGQQSLSRLRGSRSHSLSGWMASGREQLSMWVLHAAQSTGSWSKEGRQLQSVILATEGCKSPGNSRVPEADNMVFVYSYFPALSIQTIKVHAQQRNRKWHFIYEGQLMRLHTRCV